MTPRNITNKCIKIRALQRSIQAAECERNDVQTTDWEEMKQRKVTVL